jgi:Lrp/AsnC family transcriptional regulator, leucine-responsive regulatory protein
MTDALHILDHVDLQILRLLQANGRMTYQELGAAVGRSYSAVRDRVAALEAAGYLSGYFARVDWSRAGVTCEAVLWGRCAPADLPQVRAALRMLPACTEAYAVADASVVAVLSTGHPRDVRGAADALGAAGLGGIHVRLALHPLVASRPASAFRDLAPAKPLRPPGRRPRSAPRKTPANARPGPAEAAAIPAQAAKWLS